MATRNGMRRLMPRFALRSIACVALGPMAPIRTLLAAASLLAFAPALASTAAAQPQFDSWTTENGLPQNSVNDILQTRDGYLWLATFGGLVRFDGVRFVVFGRSVEGVRSERVRALYEDRRGTLWAATEDGMLIRYRNGRFVTYGREDGLPHVEAIRIEEDDAGDLWITWVGTITRFNGEHFQNFGPDHFADQVTVPRRDRYMEAWWSHDAAGLHALVAGRVRTYAIDSELSGAGVSRVVPDRCGNLWITTTSAGLIKAAPDRIERYTPRQGLLVSQRDGLFLADCKGNAWFQDARLNVYRVRNGTPERINLPPVLVIYEDRDGSLWLGTSAAGLRRLRDTAVTTMNERDGLSLARVYSILEDRAGVVWIGTLDAGLNRYRDKRVTAYSLVEGLPSVTITCIYEDRSGRLWVGTDRGLAYFAHGRFRRFEDDAGLLQGSVSAIQEDRSGTFWFATDAGLVRLSGGRWTSFTTKDGLTHDRTSALLEDRSGALWIGTFQGLTRLKDGVLTGYREREGFIGNTVRAFHEDSEGTLWVGTYDGGLYRLARNRLTRYTRNEGLHDNGVFQILEDDEGNLWTGSNRGISRVSRRELNELAEGRRRSVSPVVFGARDGLSSVEVNGGRQPAGIKARDGRLWFPTMGGVAVIDPRVVRMSAKPPSVIIEEIRLAGTPVDFVPQLRIPPGATTFEIRYTVPSFVKPEQVRFRHRLVGLDSEWIEAGDRRSAAFFHIPPGRYRFEVLAASPDGEWGASGAPLDILVLAPFWRTSWFIALVLAGGGTIAFNGHHVRTRRLRKLHELQQRFSRQLIDSQESERQRISKEVHDSLGQELGIIRKLARAPEERSGDPAGTRGALAVIGVVAERIDRQMKEIAYGLRPHQLDTIGLSKAIEGMARRVGQACDVEFTIEIEPIDDLFARNSHIHVFRIVQEAVTNLVRHAKAGRAKVVMATHAVWVEIRVEDNGTGFSPERFDATGSAMQGFGLASMRERARILGGRVEILSSLGTGTAVVVTLPIEGASLG
jgi:ligand-binding sensor domain-containing protein/signal transduction histidine kinase